MRNYEIMFIVKATLEKDDIKKTADAINEFDRKATLDEKGGNLLRHLIIRLDEEK